jgi:EPS-associated MarR family transcriptional regulator
MINDEIEYQLLCLLEKDPHVTQRSLAKQTGMSLGKVNYCLRALVQAGVIKARNFYNNKQKSAYAYYLTSKGFQEKAQVTYRFLQQKIHEYELLKEQIEELRAEFSKEQRVTITSTDGSRHDVQ